MQIPSFEQIKERKLVRWALAYLAGAWLVLQVVAILGATYAWPAWLLRAVPVVLGVGLSSPSSSRGTTASAGRSA